MKQFEFIFGTKAVVLLSSALRVSRTYGIDYIDERMMLITFAAEYDSCLYKYFQKNGRSEKDIEDGIYAYCTECLEADYLDEYGFGPNCKKFYFSKGLIKSRYSIALNDVWGDDLIDEVVIGPLCNQDKRELKDFLASCGLRNVVVSESLLKGKVRF